ncbi:hypothetical protein SAMN05421780_10258 [Flexibacter flexilis DSM 6793]|uniref:Right handed beta helix region n=1 Tax=Flexibacter flexilis DSM 6793 TaxID=927664 RepID=A0A1I1F6H9_9BACT|nr:hypothetical protein [Flexibacter flexilis]SFB94562.1 hypothetical protein SAMN05421780_10258 [Flexibacter flexilis DSM 6793]
MKRKYILTAIWTTCVRVSWVFAASFDVPNGDVEAFRNAIIRANKNTNELNVINLAPKGLYLFTSSYMTLQGTTPTAGTVALPPFEAASRVVINGNGAILRREEAAPAFRFFVAGNRSELTINQLSFQNGSTHFGGGAIAAGYGSVLSVNACKFQKNISNAAANYGGGAIYTQSQSTLNVNNSEFKNNEASLYGGAICTFLSGVWINNTKFVENTAQLNGGAVYLNGANGDEGTISLQNSLWVMNQTTENGGAVWATTYNQEAFKATKCIFSDNKAIGSNSKGGAIWLNTSAFSMPLQAFEYNYDDTQASFERCVMNNNTALENGGSLWLGGGKVNINHSMISHNHVSNQQSGLGGAIYSYKAKVNIENTTITNNFAGKAAGGVFAGTKSKISVSNTTLAYNISQKIHQSSNCGAIYTQKEMPSSSKLSEKPNCIDNYYISKVTDAPDYPTRGQTLRNAICDTEQIIFEQITKNKISRLHRWVAAVPDTAQQTAKESNAPLQDAPLAFSADALKQWKQQINKLFR